MVTLLHNQGENTPQNKASPKAELRMSCSHCLSPGIQLHLAFHLYEPLIGFCVFLAQPSLRRSFYNLKLMHDPHLHVMLAAEWQMDGGETEGKEKPVRRLQQQSGKQACRVLPNRIQIFGEQRIILKGVAICVLYAACIRLP